MTAGGERLYLEPEQAGEVRLEAAWHRPNGESRAAVAVCHPHPEYGGDMDNSVVTALCAGLVEAGIGALRFNFRGVGGSDGAYDAGKGELVDLEAALRWLKETNGMQAVAACGYSFGASIANRALDVAAIALISPANPLIPVEAPLLVATGSEDQFTPLSALRAFAAKHDNMALEVLPGSDHFWHSGLEEVSAIVVEFLRRHLLPDSGHVRAAARPIADQP